MGALNIFLLIFIFFRLFNEGFYLHSRITVQIFNSEAPVIVFNIIGWGESSRIIRRENPFMHSMYARTTFHLAAQPTEAKLAVE